MTRAVILQDVNRLIAVERKRLEIERGSRATDMFTIAGRAAEWARAMAMVDEDGAAAAWRRSRTNERLSLKERAQHWRAVAVACEAMKDEPEER